MDTRQQRYLRAKEIASAADDLTDPDRASFVDDACGGDVDLRAEVEWLLDALADAAEDSLPGMTGTGFDAIGLDSVAAFEVDRSGDQIAGSASEYRVLRQLGQGGMGTVYLAERHFDGSQQQVALKLLHAFAASGPEAERRFSAERRILASLDHPHIARLVDAGHSANGHPFLAMEYVEGVRIDQWCDQQALSQRARVRLFLKVCDAVMYAHRNLVVHRDIKPANLLVNTEGEPKLLDFGIAKLLADDAQAARTAPGRQALTIAYASPEQIRNEPFATSNDVWSLGMLLYVLLGGNHPFADITSPLDLSHAIVTGHITAPSRRVLADSAQSRERRRSIPSDLDAIVLKALRAVASERYASVAELAADLQRFLDSRPVLARRGHALYALRRHAWRLRWPLAASVAVLALLAVFLIAREEQLQQVASERNRAQQVTDFMVQLFDNADALGSRGNEVTVREMLDRGAADLQARSDLDAPLRGAMLHAMGRAYNRLHLGAPALDLLNAAQSVLPSQRDATRAALLADLGDAHNNIGQAERSLAYYIQAYDELQAIGNDDDAPLIHLKLMQLTMHMQLLDQPLPDIQKQIEAVIGALARRQPADKTLELIAWRTLGLTLLTGGHLPQAVAASERAVALASELYGAEDARVLPERFTLAVTVKEVDRARSIALFQAVIDDYERLIQTPGRLLTASLSNMAGALSDVGRIEEGIAAYRRTIELHVQMGLTEAPITQTVVLNLATLYSRHGQPQAALDLLQPSLPILCKNATQSGAGYGHLQLAAALDTLAESHARLERIDQARLNYEQAEAAYAEVGSDAFPYLRADILEGLAASHLDLTQRQDAASVLDTLERTLESAALDDIAPRRERAAMLRDALAVPAANQPPGRLAAILQWRIRQTALAQKNAPASAAADTAATTQ